MELDLEEIKATLARRDERGNDFIAGNTGRAASDRSFMLSQMRPLLEENERLARLAHAGWERARSEAEEAGNEEGETLAANTLDDLETTYGTDIAEPKS